MVNRVRNKISIIFLVSVLFLIFGPGKLTKAAFAKPQLNYTKTANSPINTTHQVESLFNYTPEQKSHAPEPSSLFLILSGIGGMIVRFAQVSFRKFKRALDILLAIVGIFIVSPILLLSALLIKFTSKGPIIYKQLRVGEKGEIFEIYKFRTMAVDAEEATGAVWARKNDPRITPIGRILRKTRIDEIPQFINVLKGEMSIVGPRPERPEMVRDFKKLIFDYEKRLAIKPGITGVAQIYNKYDESLTDVRKKIKYDLLYRKKMGPATDFTILAKTCLVVLTGKGAR